MSQKCLVESTKSLRDIAVTVKIPSMSAIAGLDS